MFVFPLGLAAKTRRFPIACVAILVGTTIISFLNFTRIDELEKRLNTSQAAQTTTLERMRLLLAACSETDLTDIDCEFLKKSLETTKPKNLTKLSDSLSKSVAKEFDSRELAAEKLEKFGSLIFSDDYWTKHSAKFEGKPEFDKYLAAKAKSDEEQLALQNEINLLSKANFNLQAIWYAEVTHGGWMHLIGNMIFFLILGIPSEERLGSLAFAALYFIGGTLGLSAQILLYDSNLQGLLGASANVSAIAGAFLALFWQQKMRVWISAMFLWNKVALVPSWIFIPLFVVMNDVTGTIEASSNVAHMAHLGGFAAGYALGILWLRLRPLPSGFVFPFESELLVQAKSLSGDKKLSILAKLLFYHPDNREAQKMAVDTMITQEDSPAQKRFLKLHFANFFNSELSVAERDFISFVKQLPPAWNLEELTDEVDLEKIGEFALKAEQKSEDAVAIRLLKVVRKNLPLESDRRRISQKIQSLQGKQINATA